MRGALLVLCFQRAERQVEVSGFTPRGDQHNEHEPAGRLK